MLMMTQGTLQSPPNTSGEESDKDITGVYFGAFETPEKRFARIAMVSDTAHHASSSTPIRDLLELSDQKLSSPALSISTCSDDLMNVERLAGLVEERDHVRTETRTEGADSSDGR